MKNLISRENQKRLLKIARETLKSYLRDKKTPKLKIDNRELNQKLGMFITLEKKGKLRGCLGDFESDLPLYQLVQKRVIDSAMNDSRFLPVNLEELPAIKIEISILSPKKKLADWRKIKLGRDGVLIKRGRHGGTFLPQVAKETGWSLEEFLSHLCWHKAGLPPNAYKDKKTDIYTYTAQVFSED